VDGDSKYCVDCAKDLKKKATADGADGPGAVGGDGEAKKVAAKGRECWMTQCTRPAKEGSNRCARCDVVYAVHREHLEVKTSCFRCRHTETGDYCDRHLAEFNDEVEKRMANQKNEATADGAGGAKRPAAPDVSVEPGGRAGGDGAAGCPKVFTETDRHKRLRKCHGEAVQHYDEEVQKCWDCHFVQEKKNGLLGDMYCPVHQEKIDSFVRGLMAEEAPTTASDASAEGELDKRMANQ
jgi:hypothetical protein